ncbi:MULTISPECIES: hypothetical protein [unclassified Pedobacter]|uniref:hypothetical protein n=1 Tax=unclassified Pedobacter TaxID=2628915 RepID=UPI0014227263|nr:MULTISPECIES: hypothetical protein [unclassified Pedobacter]NII81723.1 hypothetical protein [Pedobacter sp. SG908]NMN35727.1 hypothetical protein [Pedobacter sp. SG918]
MKLYKATSSRDTFMGPVIDITYIIADNIAEAADQAPESSKIEFISDKLIVKQKEK